MTDDTVAVNETVDNLADNLLVGEANDQTVLGRLVLVLGLAYQTLALTVIRLAFTATTEFDLVAAVIRLGANVLDKDLFIY